jgi:hypothetical protein
MELTDGREEVNPALIASLNLFKKTYEEKKQTDKSIEQQKREIIEEKKGLILPIIDLFRFFKKMQLVVHTNEFYSLTKVNKADEDHSTETFFAVHYKESTDSKYGPTPVFYIQHPCSIYVLVPNKKDREQYGEVIIRVQQEGTNCPHRELLNNKRFNNVQSALDALSLFFAKNTIEISNPQYLG